MPEANGNNQPATRADVHELEVKVERSLQRLEEKMDRRFAETDEKMDRRFAEMTERLQEFVRDTQTELLRGFQAYANGFDVRLAKLGAEFSILDQATERRLSTLEKRMLEIETRLPPMAPPPRAS
jgi:hypothetical protein